MPLASLSGQNAAARPKQRGSLGRFPARFWQHLLSPSRSCSSEPVLMRLKPFSRPQDVEWLTVLLRIKTTLVPNARSCILHMIRNCGYVRNAFKAIRPNYPIQVVSAARAFPVWRHSRIVVRIAANAMRWDDREQNVSNLLVLSSTQKWHCSERLPIIFDFSCVWLCSG